jgi:hypothetical protein
VRTVAHHVRVAARHRRAAVQLARLSHAYRARYRSPGALQGKEAGRWRETGGGRIPRTADTAGTGTALGGTDTEAGTGTGTGVLVTGAGVVAWRVSCGGRKVEVSARAHAHATHARCSPARAPRKTTPAARRRRCRRRAWCWRGELGVGLQEGPPSTWGLERRETTAGGCHAYRRPSQHQQGSRASEHQRAGSLPQRNNAAPSHALPPRMRPFFSPADQLTTAHPPPQCPACGPGSRSPGQSAAGRRVPDLRTQPSRPQAARSWPSR